MATLFLHDFTATNGTLATDPACSLSKVVGTVGVSGSMATVYGNAIIGGTLGNKSVYRSEYNDGSLNYIVRALLTWDGAAAEGRVGGVCARVSADGADGYFVLVDSNIGAARIKIVRRRAGVEADLGAGWVSMSEGPSELNAGITVGVRVQTVAAGYDVRAYVGATEYISVVDSDALGVGAPGTAGIYLGSSVVTTDISFDDLTALDFQEEATSGVEWQAGIGLVIDGVYYSEAEWAAMGLDPVLARRSFAPVSSGSINDLSDAGSPALYNGVWVKILKDGVVLSEGRARQTTQSWPPPEAVSYTLTSPRELGETVLVNDPDTGANHMSFNQRITSPDYDVARTGLTLGAILTLVYTTHTAAMREKATGPASGAVYGGSLTALDAVIENMSVSGSLLQVEEAILAFMPEFAIRVDTETRQRFLVKRSTAPIRNVDTAAGHVLPTLTQNSARNYTAIVVYGTVLTSEEQAFLFDPEDPIASTMTPMWDPTLESQYTAEKALSGERATVVVGFGVQVGGPNNGYAYVDLNTSGDFSMDVNEWAGTLFGFTSGAAAPDTYVVRTNSTSRLWFGATAFVTAPAINDTGYLTGVDDPAYSRNSYEAMFKEFDLGNFKINGSCANAIIKNVSGSKTVSVTSKVRKFLIDNGDGTTRDGIRLEMAAMGLIPLLGTLCGTDGGIGAVPSTSVEITLPVRDDRTVPKIRIPAVGYRGTAYTKDPSKWNGGGGSPGFGDPGCVAELPLPFPDFKSLALQGAEYTKMADAMLAVYGTLAVSGTIVLGAIDVTWDLNSRVTLTDTEGDRVTGFEADEGLWLLQVEYDLRNDSMTLGIGTMSSQGVNLDVFRQRYAERTRLEALRRSRELADQMRACMQAGFEGIAAQGAAPASVIPGCNVTSSVAGTSLSQRVENSIELNLDFYEFMVDLLLIQKGLNLNNADDTPKDRVGLQAELNKLFASVADGGGIGGIEGGLLRNLGKTVDKETHLIVSPGDNVGPLGGHYYGPNGLTDIPPNGKAPGSITSKVLAENKKILGWVMEENGDILDALSQPWTAKKDGTFVNPTTDATGFPAPGGTIGLLLGNLGKSLDATTGEELPPGSTTPAGGGYHYGPGGAVTPLASGAPVPSTAHSNQVAGNKAVLGLSTVAGSHNVQTSAHHGASVYTANSASGYTKQSGPGLGSPSFSGVAGALSGKCGTTFDAKADPGSGPGALLAPGAVVGADGGYYYPPTQRANDPDVVQLASGDTVPGSSVDLSHAVLVTLGLTVTTLSDEGGPVYTDGTLFWRVDPSVKKLREVDAVSAGTGENSGDYDWASPTAYYVTSAVVAFSASDKLLGRVTAGAGASEEISLTAAGRALIDDADATAQRVTLGLGGAAVLAVGTTAGTVAAGDDSRMTNARTPTAHATSHQAGGSDPVTAASVAFAASDKLLGRVTAGAGASEEISLTAAGRALIDDADATAQRVTLGLGGAAVLAVGTTAGTVAAGDDSRMTDARTPTTHATSHQVGGSDPINVGGLSGALADQQNPIISGQTAETTIDRLNDHLVFLDASAGVNRKSPIANIASGALIRDYTHIDVGPSSVAETTIFSGTLTANTLGTNRMGRLGLRGTWSQNSGASRTLRLRVKLGGTTLVDYTTPTVAVFSALSPFAIDLEVANCGATNVQRIYGSVMASASGAAPATGESGGTALASSIKVFTAIGAKDSTADLTLEVTVELSASNSNFYIDVERALLELV